MQEAIAGRIEKNIPIPPLKRGHPVAGVTHQHTFSALVRRMEVGDSVLTKHSQVEAVRGLLSRIGGEKGGWKFAIRLVDGRIRIWRTA